LHWGRFYWFEKEQRMPEPIGFIGLGNMGRPMAANLLKAGFPLKVYNRTPDKARALVEQGARPVGSPAEVASPGGVVVTVLPDDAAVESIAGDDLCRALGAGGVHVSMSTISPAAAQRLSAHHAGFGVAYVAAPVFGRPEAAADRMLRICTSGPADAKRRVHLALEAMGQGIYDFGDAPGAAHVVKLSGNFLLTAAIEAMAEAAALAEKNDIPRASLLAFLTQTLFNCPIYNNYANRIVQADFENVGFTARLAYKDMRLAAETAAASTTPMPTLNLLRDRYLALIANGKGDLDASVLANAAASDAGLTWFDAGPH
jgi:3-hydroxyisobutyrate dehydrogenase-like beta-hydroxyacid dehydrogenase